VLSQHRTGRFRHEPATVIAIKVKMLSPITSVYSFTLTQKPKDAAY